jgi:hypothetical protein
MESVKEMTLGKVLERWLGSNFKEMVMEWIEENNIKQTIGERVRETTRKRTK